MENNRDEAIIWDIGNIIENLFTDREDMASYGETAILKKGPRTRFYLWQRIQAMAGLVIFSAERRVDIQRQQETQIYSAIDISIPRKSVWASLDGYLLSLINIKPCFS